MTTTYYSPAWKYVLVLVRQLRSLLRQNPFFSISLALEHPGTLPMLGVSQVIAPVVPVVVSLKNAGETPPSPQGITPGNNRQALVPVNGCHGASSGACPFLALLGSIGLLSLPLPTFGRA